MPDHDRHPPRVGRRAAVLLAAAAAGSAGADLVRPAGAYADQTAEPAYSTPLVLDSSADQTALTIHAEGQGASFEQKPGAAPGTHVLSCNCHATAGQNSALNVTSANPEFTALQVTGHEHRTGSVKISHVRPSASDDDASAAALSIDLQGAGTAAQGIFLDATQGGTTGPLMQLRNAGDRKLRVLSDGRIQYDNPDNLAPSAPVPATPDGFLRLVIPDGRTVRVPYYFA